MFKKQVILMLVLSLVLLSCGGAVIQRDPFIPASTTVTESGNWTYITFDSDEIGRWAPSQMTTVIADAIQKWENTHPDRKIVSLQIVYTSYGYNGVVDGISIYSQPATVQ